MDVVWVVKKTGENKNKLDPRSSSKAWGGILSRARARKYASGQSQAGKEPTLRARPQLVSPVFIAALVQLAFQAGLLPLG